MELDSGSLKLKKQKQSLRCDHTLSLNVDTKVNRLSKATLNWMQWPTPIIPTQGKLRQLLHLVSKQTKKWQGKYMTTPEYIHIPPPATSQCCEHSAFVAQIAADNPLIYTITSMMTQFYWKLKLFAKMSRLETSILRLPVFFHNSPTQVLY